MPTWIGFLRAVNVGKRQVKMQALRELLQDKGFEDVETHIQSGNLKVRCATRSPSRVEAELRTLISDAFGFDVPVVVRTPAQLRPALERAFAAGAPALVNVLTDPSVAYPRRSSLA